MTEIIKNILTISKAMDSLEIPIEHQTIYLPKHIYDKLTNELPPTSLSEDSVYRNSPFGINIQAIKSKE